MHPRTLWFLQHALSAHCTVNKSPILNTSHSITVTFCFSSCLVTSHSTPPKTHSHKVMPGESGHLLPLLLLSFTSPLLLCLSHHCPAWCNTSVSDMRCNTSVNSCWLLLWAMLWGKAKLQGAETDSRGAADLLPPEPLFGYETLLSGVSALTPNEQSKHR